MWRLFENTPLPYAVPDVKCALCGGDTLWEEADDGIGTHEVIFGRASMLAGGDYWVFRCKRCGKRTLAEKRAAWERARGALHWKPGDPTATDIIRKMRDEDVLGYGAMIDKLAGEEEPHEET